MEEPEYTILDQIADVGELMLTGKVVMHLVESIDFGIKLLDLLNSRQSKDHMLEPTQLEEALKIMVHSMELVVISQSPRLREEHAEEHAGLVADWEQRKAAIRERIAKAARR